MLKAKLMKVCIKLPKIGDGEPAQVISRDLNNVLLRAAATLKTLMMNL